MKKVIYSTALAAIVSVAVFYYRNEVHAILLKLNLYSERHTYAIEITGGKSTAKLISQRPYGKPHELGTIEALYLMKLSDRNLRVSNMKLNGVDLYEESATDLFTTRSGILGPEESNMLKERGFDVNIGKSNASNEEWEGARFVLIQGMHTGAGARPVELVLTLLVENGDSEGISSSMQLGPPFL